MENMRGYRMTMSKMDEQTKEEKNIVNYGERYLQ